MSGPTPRATQIAHVLFLDIVGYSRAPTSARGRMLEQLNAAVSASSAFAAMKAAGGVQPIPTGDGMVLLFASDVIAPAQCAVEVCRALVGGSALPVRMGIHSGQVQTQIDIALLYKPSLQPDEDVLRTLEAQLRASGYEVFVDEADLAAGHNTARTARPSR